MRSLKVRIIIVIFLCSLLAILLAGGFSLIYIKERIKESTFDYLTESAKVYGNELNTVTVGLESTVDALSRSVVGIIDESRLNEPDYFYELSEETERIAAQFDNNTANVMSVYVRFDPRISYDTAGFFHADTDGDGVLERQQPTDLGIYEPSDREHVGWFYEPMRAGKAIWMDPYFNANIDIEMLSYIKPLFVDGKAIGVVGIDVNFERFKSIVTRVPKVGEAVLLNQKYHFLVHDTFLFEDTLSSIDEGGLASVQRVMEKRSDGIVEFELFGVPKILGFSRLNNGWIVVVAMTENEAFVNLNKTVNFLILLNLGTVIIMTIIAYFVGKYLNQILIRKQELEDIVQQRTKELKHMNEELESSMVNLEENQSELMRVNEDLEDSLDRLKKTQEQLIVSEKFASLGQLVAGVAHEINTPLGIGVTMNSYMEDMLMVVKSMFEADTLTKKQLQEYFESNVEAMDLSIKNLNRAADIVDTFKQVAQDQSTHDIRRINLKDYIQKILTNLTPEVNTLIHRVYVKCDDTIEIVTYPGVLAQILTNLVMNSLVHGFENHDAGEIHIEVTVVNDLIQLIYRDNGRGIELRNKEKVFNPFFTTKRNKGSAGLGLHIIHNLVTQTLKGTIRLESEPSKGVEFHLQFPISINDSL